MLYRLMCKDQIVGYQKCYPQKKPYYSVDLYGWSTDAIVFDRKDPCSGYFDKNKRMLFEGDIVHVNDLQDSFRVTAVADTDSFVLVSHETEAEIFFPENPMDGFKSYTFIGVDVSETHR